MKQITTGLFEVMFGGMILVFCLRVIFVPTEEENLWRFAGNIAMAIPAEEFVSENGDRLRAFTDMPAPQLSFVSRICETGETIRLWEQVLVKDAREQEWHKAGETEIYAELIDIRLNGSSLGRELFLADREEAEELIVPASYREDTGELCFYRSGNYVLRLRIRDSYGRSATKQIVIPVEAGLEQEAV